jgi:PAS domain S-box-containing protein
LNIPNLLHASLDNVLLKAISDFGEGVVVLDLSRIIYCNEAFSKITQCSEKELVDLSSFLDIVPFDKKKSINDYLTSSSNDRKTVPKLETTILKKDGSPAQVEVTAHLVSEANKTNVVLMIRDITDQKRMAIALKHSGEFEKLITTLSSHFINLAPHLIDTGINNAIKSIGEFIGVDRIFMFSLASNKIDGAAFEWHRNDVDATTERNDFQMANFSWFYENIKKLNVLYISSPDELPAEAKAEKELLKARGVKSIVAVPMGSDGVLRGLLTFSALRAPKKWTSEDLVLFKITGEMFANVIERKNNHRDLKENEEKFKELFNNAMDAIYIHVLSEDGLAGKFIEVNDLACTRLGYTREEMLKMTPYDITVPEAVEDINKTMKKYLHEANQTYTRTHVTKSGHKIPVEIHGHVFKWDNEKAVQAFSRDITERKRAEETIRRQAYYDILTNLPNRTLFKDRLEQAMKNANLNKQMVAVIVWDLDRFKTINETLGHLFGDKLLVAVSERLLGIFEEATQHAQKIIELLAAPFKLSNHELHVTTSIGMAFYPDDGENSEILLKNAETAMYRAKEQGRNNYQLYASVMNVSAFKQLLMENSLRRALEKEEFVVYYQPQIDIKTQRLIGAEALVRWQHPDLGLVFPTEFIGLAEETGLIVPIGEWVIRKVCAQNKKWQDAGFEKVCVSVNLSARQFQQRNLVATISRILQETALDPQYLGMEITESIAMKNADFTISALNELKKMGVHLSLDDFGTGYSSLSYLKRFPLETLKIDRSFVRDITTDPNDAAIVTAVIALAHSLKLNVVAEGVETDGQLIFLKNHDCNHVQGYIFSHPLSEENFLKTLKNYPLKP